MIAYGLATTIFTHLNQFPLRYNEKGITNVGIVKIKRKVCKWVLLDSNQ